MGSSRQPAPTGPSGSSLGKVVAVIGGTIVIALIGGIGYLALSGGDEVADPKPSDTSAPAPTEAPATNEEPPTAGPAGDAELTDVQRQAAAEARSLIDTFPHSRARLIDDLVEEFDGQYSRSDVTMAVDSLGIDWDEQALRSAEIAIEGSAHSQPGLIRLLSVDAVGYTEEQATRAAEVLDVDWSIQPERYARDFADSTWVSHEMLLSIMTTDGFEEAEAEAGIDAANIDFNAEAAEAAEEALEDAEAQTCEELTEYLTSVDGFTPEEAAYGAGSTSVC